MTNRKTNTAPAPEASPTPTRLLSVDQFIAAYPGFTKGGVRYLIFNARTNGFDVCLVKIGRRVLIDEAAFLGTYLPTRRVSNGGAA